MGVIDIDNTNPRLLNNKVCVICNKCKKEFESTAEAVYRQRRRGKDKWHCKRCSAIYGWTFQKRIDASGKTKEQWHDPDYAGKIIGKALARQIIKESE